MAKFGEGDLLKCSFCGKTQKQVKKLIAGPGVYICDECIDLCNEIIDERDLLLPRRLHHWPGPGQEDPGCRRLQPLQAGAGREW